MVFNPVSRPDSEEHLVLVGRFHHNHARYNQAEGSFKQVVVILIKVGHIKLGVSENPNSQNKFGSSFMFHLMRVCCTGY